MKGGEKMNVGTATVSTQSQQQASKATSDSRANRGSFLDMLTAATSDNEIAIEPLNIVSAKQQVTQFTEGLTADIFSKLLATLQGKDVSVGNDQFGINNSEADDENLQAFEEISKLLDLLPDYLRAEVEQILKSGDTLNLQEADQTLAQMLALFMSIASTRAMERDAQLQSSLEKVRNQLQQALKAESQLTGLNSNEILTKLDTLMSSTNNQSKQDYLQGLLHRKKC